MLEVQRYLAKKSLADLQKEFSIKVRQHGKYSNLVSLTYDQIKSPMHRSLVQECRGLVIDTSDNNAVVARAYDKFWNYGEVHGNDLNLDTTRLYEKLDGTMCCLYHYNNEWHVSTTGTPDASGVCEMWSTIDQYGTFASLFWNTFKSLNYNLPTGEGTNYCYVFELCTPFNQVVVHHHDSRLVLHGVRFIDAEGGYELAPESISQQLGLNWEVVKSFDVPKTWTAINQFVRSQPGKIFEGVVAVDHTFNRLKLKNAEYVFLHHSLSRFSLKHALEIIFTGEISEVLTYKPEYQALFDDLLVTYNEIISLSNLYLEQCKDWDRKTIGLWFVDKPQDEVHGWLKGWVFSKLFKPEFEFISIEAALLQWLHKSPGKVKKVFKVRPDLQQYLTNDNQETQHLMTTWS